MAAAIENVTGGFYNGSAAQPNSSAAPGGITTSGPNRTVVIVCITSRENSAADINQVTAITAAGLTFTRVFHDVSWTYSDATGDASFPVASHSIDIFTAPAATAQSALTWTSTMSGDGFVNHGSCFEFAVSGLTDINNPFDANVTTPITQKNASGSSSALQVAGLTTTNANDLLVAFFANHNPTTDATPSAGTGWAQISGSPIANGGGASGHHTMIQTKNVVATQAAVTVPTNYSDNYWYGVVMAFAAPSAPAFTQSKAALIC